MLAACADKPRVDPKLGVAASLRIVDDGEPVPKGGGRQQVGKPYQVGGKTYKPMENPENYSVEGLASWYGSAFHGRMTANGEVFDQTALSAAHPTLPLPSYARVTNVNNGKSVIVRVNDRGPFHGNRAVDVSKRTAELLDFKNRGMARVRVDYVGPASVDGSDDGKLMASYRENGQSAANVAVASISPEQAVPAALRDVPLRSASTPTDAAEAPAPEPVAKPAPAPMTAEAPATPATPVNIAARIDAGFSGMSTSPQAQAPQPVGAMVEPVLSGFAFSPEIGAAR